MSPVRAICVSVTSKKKKHKIYQYSKTWRIKSTKNLQTNYATVSCRVVIRIKIATYRLVNFRKRVNKICMIIAQLIEGCFFFFAHRCRII